MDAGPIGRGRERALLDGWLDDAWGGSGRVVLVAGEPGVGKTALVEAVRRGAGDRRVVVGRASEDPGAPPFWPWRQVLDDLGAGDVLGEEAGVDVAVERFARFERVVTALAAEGRGSGGLLVLLEDVHRADRDSLRLLVHVAGRLADEPVAVLATHREGAADLAGGAGAALDEVVRLPSARRLHLSGLGASDVGRLLPAGTPPAVVAQVAETTGGNPLFVLELARHLGAGGAPADVPPTLRDAVGRRAAALGPVALRVLRTAAVEGRRPTVPVVASALGVDEAEVRSALGASVDAGLLEEEAGGDVRFTHDLVGAAVRAGIPLAQRADEHRALATALEAVDGLDGDRIAEIAAHWDAAGGDAVEVAADRYERAASVAARRLAWEEAAALWSRAVERTAPSTEAAVRHRRLVGRARALLDGGEVVPAIEATIAAAEAAFDAGRADLAGEALLVAEWRGGPAVAALAAHAERCLHELGPEPASLRARLLGLLASADFYLEPEQGDRRSGEALALAERSEDPWAVAAAVHARQMASSNVDGAAERLDLARRIGEVGRALGHPTMQLWEPAWRFDALVELGRVAEADAELPALRRAAGAVGLPVARWLVARAEAALLQATGRFAAALEAGARARTLFAAFEDPLGAVAMELALRLWVRRHAGGEPDPDSWVAVSPSAPPFLADLGTLGPVVDLVDAGRLDEARAAYASVAPMAVWRVPPFLELSLPVTRLDAAIAVGRLDDVPALVERLVPSLGRHAVASGGTINHAGPVSLHVGLGRAAIGDLAGAAPALAMAQEDAARTGLAGFAVEAATRLAEVRLALGDTSEAAALVRATRPAADALGMAPWRERLDRVAARLASAGPLSAREREVAELVAQGLTNRAIGGALFISERTAQNHVQHILTKLGLANRTQVALWFGQGTRHDPDAAGADAV